MDRYAIFVDAGYVIAAGGDLCCGTSDRKKLSINVAELRDHLNCVAKKWTEVSSLRMYWYDAAPYSGPTQDHEYISNLANIKLRLGRIKNRRQKGVDALIYHDLVTLARERAISDAFLVSGDEDIREAVKTVQEMGVRVTLIGIPPTNQESNQSRELCQEADEVTILKKKDLLKFFNKKVPQTKSEDLCLAIAKDAGTKLAEKINSKSTEQLHKIHTQYPKVPKDIDSKLLSSLRKDLKIKDVPDHLRRAARVSFWDTLKPSSNV